MSEEALKQEEVIEEEGQIVDLDDPVEKTEESVAAAPVTEVVEETTEVEEKDETKEEELVDYSDKVQKRINNLTRKLREAERGQESAYEYAKRTAVENEHLKAKSSNLDRSYLMEAENRLKSQKQQAMSALKSAHEVQDYEKVAKAQEVLAKIAVEENKVNTSKMAIEQQVQETPVNINGQPQQNVQQIAPQYQAPPKLDAKQEKWVENNSWFGEDEIMTLAAFSIDQKLVKEGYDASSDEYYSEVDKRLRAEFPHKFEEPSNQSKPQQKVASAGRVAGNTSSKRQVKLSPAEVQMAKRLNVPLTEYAKYVKR